MKKSRAATYSHGPLRFPVVGYWREAHQVSLKAPDFYVAEFDGKQFGPQFPGPDAPSEYAVVEEAKKEIIPAEVAKALVLLRSVEGRTPRFDQEGATDFIKDTTAEECLIILAAVEARRKLIRDAGDLVGNFHDDLVCSICKVHYSVRSRNISDWCCRCHQLITGKKSELAEYVEHGGRRPEHEWMPKIIEIQSKNL